MRLHKTGHAIADTVSDLIGDLPDGEYNAAYGILRHSHFGLERRYFCFDKGYWGAGHYEGTYRLAPNGTQARYSPDGPSERHGQTLEPWRNQEGYTLICPPTPHVCEFFGIDYTSWLMNTIRQHENVKIRNKGGDEPVNWSQVSKLVTFNSTIGFEALRRGIEVISNPDHSTIGSYCASINKTVDYDRDVLLSFCQAHQFRLSDKEKICKLVNYYMSLSDTTQEKQSAQTY